MHCRVIGAVRVRRKIKVRAANLVGDFTVDEEQQVAQLDGIKPSTGRCCCHGSEYKVCAMESCTAAASLSPGLSDGFHSLDCNVPTL